MTKKKETLSEDPTLGIKFGPTALEKLHDAGASTPYDVLVIGPQELAQITGDKYEDAEIKFDSVVTYLEEKNMIDKQSTLAEVTAHKAKMTHLSCGCTALDDMLRGGVPTQGITEVYGADGAGKTQFVLSLAESALDRGEGVIYLDCEGTFELDRILEIANARGHNLSDKLENLQVLATQDTHTIRKTIKFIIPEILEKKAKLIIVDGMVGIFRFEYDQGRGELNDRQNLIKHPLRHLKRISEFMNVGVVVTNQVTANPNAGYGADPMLPIGGYIFGHTARYIIKFNKGGKAHRTARLVKSNKDSQYDCEFWLNEAGVWDEEKVKLKKDSLLEA